jgi:putative aldouronate transport system substrate-binding protein
MSKKSTVLTIIVGIIFSLLLVTACSNSDVSETSKSNDSKQETETNTSDTSSTSKEKADPFGKYDPAIEVTTIRSIGADFNFDEGEDIDNNAIYDAYENDLGIKIKNVWTVDQSQYNEKIRLAIASNDIPDFFQVPGTQDIQTLVEADMVMALDELFDKYASEDTKEWFNKDGGAQLDSSRFDGKLMAIPATGAAEGSAQFLWVRKDWLQKLDLPEPKTMEDVRAIAKAFTEQDPDGNNKNDTTGLALTNVLDQNMAHGITGFFNGYHAYPGIWIEKNGELVYGSVQPEMKEALASLREMYKNKQIPQEFAVKDVSKINELVANNRLGISYGAFWQGAWPLQGAIVKDGKLTQEWEVYAIPSVDNTPAKSQIQLGVTGYYVVSKNAKNPEAVIKIINQWVKANVDPNADKVYRYGKSRDTSQSGKQFYKLNPIVMFAQDNIRVAAEGVSAALANNDTSLLINADMENRYEAVKKYENGDVSQWGMWIISKQGGTYPILADYYNNNQLIQNKYYGPPTETMITRNSILKQKEQEMMAKVIMGELGLDAFDNFVKEWHRLGGEQITQEVNEWYSKR